MMKSCSFSSFLPAVMAATSLAFASSAFSPAKAYSVVTKNEQAGNPSGYLNDVTVNSQDDIGRQLDPVKWLVPKDTTNGKETTPIDLSAVLDITVVDLNASSLKLAMKITNTTALTDASYRADIVSFGFGVSPNADSVEVIGGKVFDSAEIQKKNQNFPGGFKNIDVCIYAKGCSGGGAQGLDAGASDVFELIISGNFDADLDGVSQVTLSDFPLKFQTDNGSFEPAGVPEPLTVVGSGLALGFGALFKKEASRRRNKAVVKL